MDLRRLSFVVFALLLQCGSGLEALRKGGKAYLDMSMVQPICEYTHNYAQQNEIQPALDVRPATSKAEEKACKFVRWSACGDSKDCVKFKLARCDAPSENKSGASGTDGGGNSAPSPDSDSNGAPKGGGARIIDANDTLTDEFPHTVRLVDSRTMSTFCGGTIIALDRVLTASPCLVNRLPEFIRVVGGDHEVTLSEPAEQWLGVKAIVPGPTDICSDQEGEPVLLILSGLFNLTASVKPAKLIERMTVDVEKLHLSGWGTTNAKGCAAQRMRKKEVQALSDAECKTQMQAHKLNYNVNLMCLTQAQVGLCGADMGSPVAYKQIGSSDFVLIGMVLGAHNCLKDGLPNTILKVGGYFKWLTATHSNVNNRNFHDIQVKDMQRKSNQPAGGSTARVVGGKDAKAGEFPHNVRILNKTSSSFVCGGALVGSQLSHVLTAAACVANRRAEDLVVFAGEVHVTEEEAGEQQAQVRTITHPACYATNHFENNLAVLTLQEPFRKTAHVAPAVLSDQLTTNDLRAHALTLTGWGRVAGGCKPATLQKLELRLRDNDLCMNFRKDYALNNSKLLCSFPSDDDVADVCEGDLGSPLVHRPLNQPAVLVGIASAGFSCSHAVSVYVHVGKFLKWLEPILATPSTRRASAPVRNFGGGIAGMDLLSFHARILSTAGVFYCGGVILNARHVLTVAQCVAGKKAGEVQVVVGEGSLHTFDGTEQVIGVTKVMAHPEFSLAERRSDVAVLRLAGVIKWTEASRPVAIATSLMAEKAEGGAWVSGWGMTRQGCRTDWLQNATVNVISDDSCRLMQEELDVPLHNTHVCSVGTDFENLGACEGEFGSSLVYRDEFNGYILIGLVSFGNACNIGNSVPNVATEIAYFQPWIHDMIRTK